MCAAKSKILKIIVAITIITLMAASSTESAKEEIRPEHTETETETKPEEKLSAIILGASGATGRQLLVQALSEERFPLVKVLSRRSIVSLLPPDFLSHIPPSKFEEILFDDLSAVDSSLFSGFQIGIFLKPNFYFIHFLY